MSDPGPDEEEENDDHHDDTPDENVDARPGTPPEDDEPTTDAAGATGPTGDRGDLPDDVNPEAPLGDLAADLSESDLAAAEQELFEQKGRPEIDREALWRQVADEETAERAVEELDIDESDGPEVRRDTGDGPVSTGERVVEKASYCHVCPHFSAPPETHCTHEGTEILEAVDMKHFRVRDCPIVAENEDIEDI